MQAPKADFNKIQSDWLKTLEQYIADYPASPDAAEAMLQLGIAREFAGQEEDAKRWYGRVAKDFAESPGGKEGGGARSPGSIRSARRSSCPARASKAARSTWRNTAARWC